MQLYYFAYWDCIIEVDKIELREGKLWYNNFTCLETKTMLFFTITYLLSLLVFWTSINFADLSSQTQPTAQEIGHCDHVTAMEIGDKPVTVFRQGMSSLCLLLTAVCAENIIQVARFLIAHLSRWNST